jgi:broad-specificity NMP kinase
MSMNNCTKVRGNLAAPMLSDCIRVGFDRAAEKEGEVKVTMKDQEPVTVEVIDAFQKACDAQHSETEESGLSTCCCCEL